jgi:hypothetical protein
VLRSAGIQRYGQLSLEQLGVRDIIVSDTPSNSDSDACSTLLQGPGFRSDLLLRNRVWGSSQAISWPAGQNDHYTNMSWMPKSFNDYNNNWHVVVYAGPNGTGNLTQFDSSQSDLSYLSSQSSTGQWSVKVYLNGC